MGQDASPVDSPSRMKAKGGRDDQGKETRIKQGKNQEAEAQKADSPGSGGPEHEQETQGGRPRGAAGTRSDSLPGYKRVFGAMLDTDVRVRYSRDVLGMRRSLLMRFHDQAGRETRKE